MTLIDLQLTKRVYTGAQRSAHISCTDLGLLVIGCVIGGLNSSKIVT